MKRIYSMLLMLLCVISINAQSIRRLNKAGIECVPALKGEETMASDNEYNRETLCYGYNEDGHYKVAVYMHRGIFYSVIWGQIYENYSVNVYSTHIESDYPIDCTHDVNATFPNSDLIDYCKRYGIKKLYFYGNVIPQKEKRSK